MTANLFEGFYHIHPNDGMHVAKQTPNDGSLTWTRPPQTTVVFFMERDSRTGTGPLHLRSQHDLSPLLD